MSTIQYCIAGIVGSLAVGFITAKGKSIKYISMYLELHQIILYCQILICQLLKRQFLPIPPNVTTANIFEI